MTQGNRSPRPDELTPVSAATPADVPRAAPPVPAASLHVWTPRRPVQAVALVLHGGRAQSTVPTVRWQLSYARMLPFDWALRRAAGRRGAGGLAVARLRYRVRGWNGPAQSPVADAREALATLRSRFPDVPIALVGHSMGGRTSLYVADDPAVRVVVGLAPWIQPGDPERTLAGRRVLFLHGDRDTWTDPRATRRYAESIRPIAASVTARTVGGDDHTMLRRFPTWHRATARFVVDNLFADERALPRTRGTGGRG